MNDALTSFRGMRKDAENNPLDKLEKLDKLDSIDNLQAASELVAETVEQKSNEVIGAVEDNTAANELTAENTQSTAGNTQKTYEELQKLNSFSSQMNEKLRGFGVMMERRFSVVSKITSGLDAIEKAIKDEKQPEQTMPSPQPVLPSVPEQQNNDNYPTLPKKPKDDKKKKKKDKNSDRDNNMQLLIKAVRGGFKETVGVSNKIFSMLFKMTVTAMFEVVKWGAILLGIVVAVDTLMIHFRYWSKQFDENFGEFMRKAGNWGSTLDKVLTSVESIQNYWENKEYGELVTELVSGLADVLVDAFFQLDRIITKGLASVLRSIPGMGSLADTLEYGALKQAQARSGVKMDEREKELYARMKKEEEIQKGMQTQAKLANQQYSSMASMQVEPILTEQEKYEVTRMKELKSVSDDAYRKSSNITIDVEGDMVRNISMLKTVKPGTRPDKLAALDKDVNEQRKVLDNPDLLSTDRQKIKELLDQYDKIRITKNAPAVTPPPPDETDTAKQAKSIEQGQLQNIRNDNTVTNTANVANTKIYNNNRTVQITRPQTSTPSPGLLQKGIV